MSGEITGQAVVVPPEARSAFRQILQGPYEVKVLAIVGQEGDDCVEVKCEYPDGLVKYHQMFLHDTVDKLLTFIVQTFRGAYDIAVVPTNAIPPLDHLVGAVIPFIKGE